MEVWTCRRLRNAEAPTGPDPVRGHALRLSPWISGVHDLHNRVTEERFVNGT